MQVNKIQSTDYNSKNKKTPVFKALYFRTPEIQEAVSRMPRFVEFIKNDKIKTLARNFNIVITDFNYEDIIEIKRVPKTILETESQPIKKSLKTKILEGLRLKEKTSDFESITTEYTYEKLEKVVVRKKIIDDFLFKSCCEISSKDNETIPSGLYTTLMSASDINCCYKRHKLLTDLKLLEKKEEFEKLKFSNPKEKERFLDKNNAQGLLFNEQIDKLLEEGRVIIITDGENGSFYVANDIKEEEDGIVKPYGFRTRLYENIKEFDCCFYSGYFNRTSEFEKIYFPNDESREKFLDSKVSLKILTSQKLNEALDKYNLIVSDCDWNHYSYCLSTDLAIDMATDTIIPAGFVTPTYRSDDYFKSLEDLVEHLNSIMEINGLASNSVAEEKLDV